MDAKVMWLWLLVGWLAGAIVGIALVALLNGATSAAGSGAIQGIVPGLVLLTGQWLRNDRAAATLRPHDVALIVSVYAVFLLIAFWLDQRVGEPLIGRWASSWIGFTAASIGSWGAALKSVQSSG